MFRKPTLNNSATARCRNCELLPERTRTQSTGGTVLIGGNGASFLPKIKNKATPTIAADAMIRVRNIRGAANGHLSVYVAYATDRRT